MGKQIRKRTPEEQTIHDQIIDRLVAGESAVELSAEIGIKATTLRRWRAQQIKKNKRELESASDALITFSECKSQQSLDKSNGVLSVGSDAKDINVRDSHSVPALVPGVNGVEREVLRERNDELGDELKTLLLSQAIVPSVTLGQLRGGIDRALTDSDASFRQSFQRLRRTLEQGIIDPDTGEAVELTLGQLKLAVSMLKDLTKAYADLHLLPHGAIKSAPLRFSDSVPPQHLHLHSHGQRSQPKALEVIDVECSEDVEPSAKDSLSDEQAGMVKDL